jgi:hypothetical protein
MAPECVIFARCRAIRLGGAYPVIDRGGIGGIEYCTTDVGWSERYSRRQQEALHP